MNDPSADAELTEFDKDVCNCQMLLTYIKTLGNTLRFMVALSSHLI